ncbi:MAG: putative soluble pyridine nucleotide transhydrogenase [Chlamydiae bacterium]|nr:putative soluble pyridine nucleotide transhydrogenase [Chlamydiota bacterium]
MKNYDLIVIGTGPGGEKAAVKAAYFGHRVAIVEKEEKFGGAEVVTGTIPSKTLKETALYFSGKYEKGLYGIDRDLRHEASVEDFMFRKNRVSQEEGDAVEENLKLHKVDIYHGVGSFEDAHTIKITSETKEEKIRGEAIILAPGSYPYHPPDIPFDGKRIHDSDTILEITRFPKSLCVVGAGVIGCEYTTIFSTMGTKVHLVNNRDKILPFLDTEVSDALVKQMDESGVSILFNTSIKEITVPKTDEEMIQISLESGEKIEVDMFLFAAGRSGNTAALHCENAGVEMGKRETILVDKTYQTNVPHIYAVGDAIGFPALASTSMDQGRVAVAHIFQTKDLDHLPSFFPYGIYTVPEVSMVGVTEDEAKEQKLDYLTGKARYSDMVRGKIMGAKGGFLKLIFEKEHQTILGVHVIGNIATEIIHFGLALVEEKKSLFDLIGTVINFPSLHELYKYAAYDGLSNLTGHKVKR